MCACLQGLRNIVEAEKHFLAEFSVHWASVQLFASSSSGDLKVWFFLLKRVQSFWPLGNSVALELELSGAWGSDCSSSYCVTTVPVTGRSPEVLYEGLSKISRLAAWSENCKWYSSLPLGAVGSYFVIQSSEFCRHNPLCCFSTSVCCYFVIDLVRKLLDTPRIMETGGNNDKG